MKDVAKNFVYGPDKSAFHVKLATASNFNVIALNDQLQFVETDSIVLEIPRGGPGPVSESLPVARDG